jgi:hypothetical protein
MRLLPLLLTASFLTPVPVVAQSPSTTKPSTASPAPAGPPFTEVQFYRLLQENQGRDTLTEDVERALRERGISFEVTDTILDSARELGATPRVVAALMKAEETRRKNGGISSVKPAPPSSTAAPAASTPTTQPATPSPQPAEKPKPSVPPQPAAQTSQPPQKRTPILARPAAGSSASPEERVAERVAQRVATLPLIEQAREFALGSMNDLPDFLADQSIRRSTLIRGAWQHRDLLETTVSYEQEGGEKVRLVSVDGQPTTRSYEDVGGTTNVGTFSFHLTSPFNPNSNGTFTEAGREKYRGRDCLIYRYKVPLESSKYQLRAALNGGATQTTIVGYSGRMWIDRDTKYVLRVEMEADDVPADFPMSHTEVVVDYDWVSISGRRFWMPVNAEALAEFPKQGQTFLNVIDFRNYRKFEGEIQVVD